jgi:hypothetical protein
MQSSSSDTEVKSSACIFRKTENWQEKCFRDKIWLRKKAFDDEGTNI